MVVPNAIEGLGVWDLLSGGSGIIETISTMVILFATNNYAYIVIRVHCAFSLLRTLRLIMTTISPRSWRHHFSALDLTIPIQIPPSGQSQQTRHVETMMFGPTSTTLAQHQNIIVSTCHVYWDRIGEDILLCFMASRLSSTAATALMNVTNISEHIVFM